MIDLKNAMKKVLSITFVFVLLLSFQPFHTAAQEKFADLPDTHWSKEAVYELVDRNILNGYPDGTFQPNKVINRAEFAKLLVLASGMEVTESEGSSFADVPETAWYQSYVENSKNYFTGYDENGTTVFKPNEPALREDIAVAIVKLKGLEINPDDIEALAGKFTDFEDISEKSRGYVAAAVKEGIISGYPDQTFQPEKAVSRAEAATLLWKSFLQDGPTEQQQESQGNQEICKSEEDCLQQAAQYLEALQAKLGSFVVDSDEMTEEHSKEVDEETKLAVYNIENLELVRSEESLEVSEDLQEYQEDTEYHEELWMLYKMLFPEEYLTYVKQFVVFTDGADGVMAMVEPLPEEPTTWLLSIDIQDAGDFNTIIYNLVHEFGHILTLNHEQVPMDVDVFNQPDNDEIFLDALENCEQYFTGEGCSRPHSYINQFFNLFWYDIYEEWLLTEEESVDGGESLYAFYEKYQSEFVTEYAATNPGEDIAESWTYFVLTDIPEGQTIAEEKILFFYQFPELIEMRTLILKNLHDLVLILEQ